MIKAIKADYSRIDFTPVGITIQAVKVATLLVNDNVLACGEIFIVVENTKGKDGTSVIKMNHITDKETTLNYYYTDDISVAKKIICQQ